MRCSRASKRRITGPEFRVVPSGGQPAGPAYDYYMSKFEITNDEFVRFLNDAQANRFNARGTNLHFDAEGDVWINPEMQRERDEVFAVRNSRVQYFPEYPVGFRYSVAPDVPATAGRTPTTPSPACRGNRERVGRARPRARARRPPPARPAVDGRRARRRKSRQRYAGYAALHPDELKIVGVAEPVAHKNERFAKKYGIPDEHRFVTWEHALDVPNSPTWPSSPCRTGCIISRP